MILRNFSAVNESSSDGDTCNRGAGGSKESEPQFHQELEEEKYVGLYNRALSLFSRGKVRESLSDFLLIFESQYFKIFGHGSPRAYPVAVKLQKCVAKYLGFCYEKEGNHGESIKYLKKSLSIDQSDVTLYFKVALSSIKINDLPLARSALEAGLKISPEHWPSLELVIMVSFKTKDHFGCLQHISKALSLDPSYAKALSIRDQIVLENKHYGINLGIQLHDPKAVYTPTDLPSCNLATPAKEPKPIRKLILDTSLFTSVLNEFARDYESVMSSKDASLQMIESIILVEKTPPSKVLVSVQNSVNEIVDFAIEEEKTDMKESERIARNILMTEVFDRLPLFSSQDFVDEIINDMIDEVVASGSDFLVNLQATEIRRSSRARVSVIDKTDSDSAGNSRAGPSEDPIRSYLASFIPDTLLNPLAGKKDDGKDPKEKNGKELMEGSGSQISPKVSFERTITGELECQLVQDFWLSYIQPFSEQGLLCVIGKTLVYLFQTLSFSYNWTESIVESFYSLYLYWRHHFVYPDFYEPEIQTYFQLMVFANEAGLDIEKQALTKQVEQDQEVPRPKGFYKYLRKDLKYMKINYYELEIDWQIRIMSLEFAHMIINEDQKSSLKYGERLKELFSKRSAESSVLRLPFPHYRIYTPSEVDNTFESLKRNSLVDKISSLFEKKDYKTVVSVLEHSLSQKTDERTYQLSLLIESYWNLNDFSNTLKWSSVALCDFIEEKTKGSGKEGGGGGGTSGVTQSRRGPVEDFTWTVDCFDLLKTIECCLVYTSMKDALPLHLKSRLLKELLKIIVIQIDFYAKQFVIKSVLPWIFVYRLIESENEESHPEVAFLISSHDYLGQLSLCTEDHGKLLLLLLEDGFKKNALPKKAIEQALFCLFSHPSKKSRVKHLTDHGVSQIALTFEKSILVYTHYLKPSTIPEFDDFKSNSISNDTEHFFKRMVALLPVEDSSFNREELMMNSITSGKMISLSKKGKPLNEELKDFYYLLADYYFKNSEFKPAISYYLLDLSYNEKRIDSWIALSLALANRVEEGINDVFKPTNHKDILKHFNDASNCFQLCISHKPREATVYIEFANFSYVMHSFCIRTLESAPETLSIDTFQAIEKIKDSSIDNAEKHYSEAFQIVVDNLEDLHDDERWLLYLMLGKVKEKQKKPFVQALELYMKSLENLLYQGASITKKISYNAPQDFSLELLEVYYRMHTSTLKRRDQKFTVEEQKKILKMLTEAHDKVANKNASDPPADKVPKLSEEEDPKKLRSKIVDSCIKALEFTVKYFSQQFRAFYVLSHYYAKNQNFKKARVYLLGAESSNKNSSGLFVDRKSNNLFNGIWRSPLTELDRAGGFTVHISKATSLLLDVLLATDDFQILAEVTAMLKKPPPDGERTYLNDVDRITFARQAQTFYSRAVASAVKKAKDSVQSHPVETVKKLLDLQQVYAKTRKTFREDSVRAMLIDLLNCIGIKCSAYDEVASFCQRLNAEKGILDEYAKNFEKIKNSSVPEPKSSPSVPSSSPSILSNSNVVISPSLKVGVTQAKPPTKPSPAALDLSTSSFTIGNTTIKGVVPSTSSLISPSPLLSNSMKKFSSATAYKASSALSSSILKCPSLLKTASPPATSTSLSLSKKSLNNSKPSGSSNNKIKTALSPKSVPSFPKTTSGLFPKNPPVDKNPFVVPTTSILSPPRQLTNGVTIQKKTFVSGSNKKNNRSKSFDLTASNLKGIVKKPAEVRNQLKNFGVNLQSLLKKGGHGNAPNPPVLIVPNKTPSSPGTLSSSAASLTPNNTIHFPGAPSHKPLPKVMPKDVPPKDNNKKCDIDVICID